MTIKFMAIKISILWVAFYGFVTPIALFLKIIGFDPLRIKKNSNHKSYWIMRTNNKKKSLPSNFYTQFIEK